MSRNLFSGFLVLMLATALILSFAQPAGAAPLSASWEVTTASDSGAGSLRQAIVSASGGDTITFNGDYTIRLASSLTINESLTIDGSGHVAHSRGC